ncbi:glycosyltransferase family 2 protein [Psychroserpens mesophilus]|uniref:glycosyltransferase family 2 protein n=1 Tax=Psychroserpens mesophilus TaxID=325473 RepID=UPI003D65DC6A
MLISIITINYNDLEGIKKTVNSVFNQSYKAIEYIIIDGGSTDGSETFIKEHTSQFSYAVSEKDEGVYHAMNKGIDQANGDYLLFLNSGDYLVNQDVIKMFVEKNPKAQIVYGDVYKKIGDKMVLFKMPEIDGLVSALRNSLIHQAVFFSKSLFNNNNRYDISYKIAADWVFINNAFIFQKCTTKHIDLVIVCYDTNGISSDKSLRLKDRTRYLQSTFDENFIVLLNAYNTLSHNHTFLKKQLLVKTHFRFLTLKAKMKDLFKPNHGTKKDK